MKEEELKALLALQKTKGIGDIIAKRLINHCGSAQKVLEEKKAVLEKIDGIGTFITSQLNDSTVMKAADKEMNYILTNNVSVIDFQSCDYPFNLKHCVDGPILLFKDGNIAIEKQKTISIVGTRNMTAYGRDFIRQLIEAIAVFNPIIVSGFAYGVDIEAHKSAIHNNLQTIGVLAHGLETIYPKSHKKYVHQVNEKGGFYTEFWHDEMPLRENFLKRNRIVAGISQTTVIIESAERGGSLVTAEIANSYSRDVFAVPGRTTDLYSKGCNMLIHKNQAAILNSFDDLIHALQWEFEEKPLQIIQKQLFVDLTKEEHRVYDLLNLEGKKHLDTLAVQLQMPIYQLLTLLFDLEMKGLVRPLQGKIFESI